MLLKHPVNCWTKSRFYSGVSTGDEYRSNWLDVRMILLAWFHHLEECSRKEVQFKKVCTCAKTSCCPPAENIDETWPVYWFYKLLSHNISYCKLLLLFRFSSTILTVVHYKEAEQLQVMTTTSVFWISTNKCLLLLLVSWIALGVTLFSLERQQTSWLMMWKTTQISSIEM